MILLLPFLYTLIQQQPTTLQSIQQFDSQAWTPANVTMIIVTVAQSIATIVVAVRGQRTASQAVQSQQQATIAVQQQNVRQQDQLTALAALVSPTEHEAAVSRLLANIIPPLPQRTTPPPPP